MARLANIYTDIVGICLYQITDKSSRLELLITSRHFYADTRRLSNANDVDTVCGGNLLWTADDVFILFAAICSHGQ